MTFITATDILVLLTGFFEGCGFFSFLGMTAYYTKNITGFSQIYTSAVVHWFLTTYCFGITFVPIVYMTKLGLYWTILLVSSLACLVSPLFLVHYHYMIVPKIQTVAFIHQKLVYLLCVTLHGLTSGCKAGCVLGIVQHGIRRRSDDDATRKIKFLSFSCTLIHCAGMFIGYFPYVMQLDEYYEMDFYKIFFCMTVSNFLGFAILRIGRKKLPFNEIKTSPIMEFIKLSHLILKTKITKAKTQELKTKMSLYTPNEIAKLKIVYRVLPLFIPVILLITLRDQKYTRFVQQSEAMNNEFNHVVFHPTFLLSLSPLVIFLALLIFVYIVGPFARKIGHPMGPTHRSIAIFVLAVLAFAGGVIMECKVEGYRKPYIKPNNGHLQIYNPMSCPATLSVSGYSSVVFLSPFNYSVVVLEHLAKESEREVTLEMTCYSATYRSAHTVSFWPDETVSYAAVVDFYTQRTTQTMHTKHRGIVMLIPVSTFLCSISSPTVRIVYDVSYDTNVEFRSINHNRNYTYKLKAGEFDIPPFCLLQDEYTIWINNILVIHETLGAAGEFSLLVSQRSKSRLPATKLLIVVPSNEVSLFYQVPQYVLIDFIEVIIRAPGFIYAETKVPPEWIDLLPTLWYASETLGNMARVVGALTSGISRQLFAFLLWYCTGLIALIGVCELLLKYYKENYDEIAEKRGILQ